MKSILFVDLDESLIKTDILREQLVRAFGQSFWGTLKMLFQKRFRPERVKAVLAPQIDIDPSTLPYNADVLELIHAAKKEGRFVVLATATHEYVAHRIAKYLGIFDSVLATTDTHNCKGNAKLEAMKTFSGNGTFDYVGDSKADLKIFPKTQMAYIVGNLSYKGLSVRIKRPSIFKPFLRLLRAHQWVKNGFIFLALFVNHQFFSCKFFSIFLGFLCLSFIDSAIHIVRDMVKVEDDRHHSVKKNRPFAQGLLTIDEGIKGSCFLLILSIALCAIFIPQGLWILGVYIMLTMRYSFSSKTKIILNVLGLIMLYVFRIFYGYAILFPDALSIMGNLKI